MSESKRYSAVFSDGPVAGQKLSLKPRRFSSSILRAALSICLLCQAGINAADAGANSAHEETAGQGLILLYNGVTGQEASTLGRQALESMGLRWEDMPVLDGSDPKVTEAVATGLIQNAAGPGSSDVCIDVDGMSPLDRLYTIQTTMTDAAWISADGKQQELAAAVARAQLLLKCFEQGLRGGRLPVGTGEVMRYFYLRTLFKVWPGYALDGFPFGEARRPYVTALEKEVVDLYRLTGVEPAGTVPPKAEDWIKKVFSDRGVAYVCPCSREMGSPPPMTPDAWELGLWINGHPVKKEIPCECEGHYYVYQWVSTRFTDQVLMGGIYVSPGQQQVATGPLRLVEPQFFNIPGLVDYTREQLLGTAVAPEIERGLLLLLEEGGYHWLWAISRTNTGPLQEGLWRKGEKNKLIRVEKPQELVAGRSQEPPKEITNSIGMTFVLIPAGKFQMGSDSADAFDWEKHEHAVQITKPYYLGKFEVTQAQWKAVMGGENPSTFKGDTLPVESVSWGDVQKFIAKLNEQEGTNLYRLPTEAEWEYAARGTDGRVYPWGPEPPGKDNQKVGNFGDISGKKKYSWITGVEGYDDGFADTAPVGSFPKGASPFGALDMAGNVWEWVQDCWHDNYDDAPKDGRAWEENCSGSARVRRGASFYGDGRVLRVSCRAGSAPSDAGDYLGFRCARSIP